MKSGNSLLPAIFLLYFKNKVYFKEKSREKEGKKKKKEIQIHQ